MGKFRETFKIQEVYLGLIIGFVLSAILIYLLYSFSNFSVVSSNYGTFASLSAAFIGFLITAFTILFAFPEEGKIKKLKNHRLYAHIFYLFLISILAYIILFLLSLMGLLFNFTIGIYSVIILFVIIESTILLILILWILKRMLDLYFRN